MNENPQKEEQNNFNISKEKNKIITNPINE